ncbi:SDR family NAD(P)-dependent oxidoreductase [Agrobacterium sp. a22-2]|uniref:SDR family oxidoreductase n=1 Tax=Agrobacterium sp. a22-2 TaxID=2283840 RepID=UPI0014480720|nr:SDR family NAD(P)-dependent oxidoreductase [Agrobacterium sp. a22-2]NKN38144.1 SDR family NAD(P)-dependent oxidoreductase [Agrobacterium sp. a22-2]
MDYRCALVTGASKGIGAAIASRLVGEGLTVYALGRSEASLTELASQLGDRLRPLVADVRDHAAIAERLAGVEIDVLVNNAGGISTVRPLHEQTAEETEEVIALNLTAPLQLIRMMLPGMIARQRGHIFNLTSTAASAAFPGTTSYGAAKAGLSQAGRILRYDLAGTGVRLTEIAPGRVETQFYLQAFGGDAATLQERMYTQQRPLRPEDIAAVLVCALTLPPHADVAELTISPTDQATGGHVYPLGSSSLR